MTVRQDEANGSGASLDEAAGSTRAQSPAPSRRRLSRRLMLRGAGAALPVMLTLHSGAALARSSNVISGSGEPQPDGTVMCLDESSGTPIDDGRRIDLGKEGVGEVWEIPGDGRYFAQPDGTEALSAADACKHKGDLYYASGAEFPKSDKVNAGILLSATAYSSFVGRGLLVTRNL